MRNLFAFLACAVVTFGVLGWYLDWYTIQSTPTAQGRHSVRIDFDKEKIEVDVHKGIQKGREKLNEALEEARKAKEARESLTGKPPTVSVPNN